MSFSNQVSDKTIIRNVQLRLARSGLGTTSKLTVTSQRGTVTLSGTLQYELQRRNAIAAARGVEGVRGVVDRLQAKPREKKWC